MGFAEDFVRVSHGLDARFYRGVHLHAFESTILPSQGSRSCSVLVLVREQHKGLDDSGDLTLVAWGWSASKGQGAVRNYKTAESEACGFRV